MTNRPRSAARVRADTEDSVARPASKRPLSATEGRRIFFRAMADGGIHPEDAASFIARLPMPAQRRLSRRLADCRLGLNAGVEELVSTDGETGWRISGQAVPDPDGAGIEIYGMIQELAEPFTLESAATTIPLEDPLDGLMRGRTDGHRLFAATLHETAQAVAIHDRATDRVIYANPAFEKLFGIGAGARPWTDLIADRDDPESRRYAEATDRMQPFTGTLQARNTRTGRTFPARCIIDTVNDRTTDIPRYLIGICEDYSLEMDRIAALESALETKNRATDAKMEFMRAISHDLRQPIFALGLLGERARPLLERERQGLGNTLVRAINALHLMLDSLVDMSALSTSSIAPNPKPFDLRELLKEIAAEFSFGAGDSGRRVVVSGAPTRLCSDRLLIARCLRNLMRNAVTHSGATVIDLSVWREAEGVYCAVRDDGKGIPPELHERIFEDYVQVEPGTGGGLGLGLSIVKGIAELIGGHVSLDSGANIGTRFVLFVPYKPRGDAPPKSRPESRQGDPAARTTDRKTSP